MITSKKIFFAKTGPTWDFRVSKMADSPAGPISGVISSN